MLLLGCDGFIGGAWTGRAPRDPAIDCLGGARGLIAAFVGVDVDTGTAGGAEEGPVPIMPKSSSARVAMDINPSNGSAL